MASQAMLPSVHRWKHHRTLRTFSTVPARQVAEILGIPEQQVYLASSRIIQRLRDAVARLKAELGE